MPFSRSSFTLTFSLILSFCLVARGGTIDILVADSLVTNPELHAARLRWEAMLEKPAIAGALPDPMISYGYFFQNVETRVGAQNQKIGLSQKIPFPGKLSDAKRRAGQEALLAMWDYQRRIREVILQVRVLGAELYRIDRSAAILREQTKLVVGITESSQRSFEAGKATLQEVLKSKLARTDLLSRLLMLAQQRASVVARLNALRARPPSAELPAITSLALPSVPSETALYPIAQRYRQELRQAGVAITRDEIGLALARKDRLPDFTVGVDYTQVNRNIFLDPPDNGHDAVFGYVSVNLPIWFGKLNAEERMAQKTLEASRASAADALLQTQAEVRDAWYQAQTSAEQVALFRSSFLPQAQDTFQASQSGYSAAKVSLVDLLDSERSLLDVKLGLVLNEAQLGKALAALERSVGVDLSAIKQETGKNHDQ